MLKLAAQYSRRMNALGYKSLFVFDEFTRKTFMSLRIGLMPE